MRLFVGCRDGGILVIAIARVKVTAIVMVIAVVIEIAILPILVILVIKVVVTLMVITFFLWARCPAFFGSCQRWSHAICMCGV